MRSLAQESKLPQVQTTIFTVMSQLAAQHGALNLAQGFPDFSGPPELMERVSAAMARGLNQYAPMPGVPLLRQRIAEKIAALYGAQVDMDQEITVTCGATEALFVAIQTLVRPGDEVIVFDPAYDSYEPAVQLAGGQCRHLRLSAPDFRIDFDALRAAINPRTRLIIVNSPHNPSGAVFQSEDLAALREIIEKHELYLLSDEVYEHIVFDGHSHCSLLSDESLRGRSFVVSSFGKTYHCTGWKVGYCVAPAEMTAEFRKIHQYTTFSISTPFQHALAEFMAGSDHHLQLADFYQRKRDLFRQGLADSGWQLLPCQGTYFQLASYQDFAQQTDVTMARQMTAEHGVAAIPISVFYADGLDQKILRFCFAKNDETLMQGVDRLRQLSLL